MAGQNFQGQKDSAQASLFGEESEVNLPEPAVPYCEWRRHGSRHHCSVGQSLFGGFEQIA